MQDEKLELSVLVDPCSLTPESYSDTSIFYKLQFITLNPQDQVHNCSSSWGSEPFAGFDNLIFRCYLSWHPGQKFSADSWEMLYGSVYSVDLRDAERMVKTLKRIRKITDAFVVRPVTFGQFVAMIASALGIKRFAKVSGRSRGWHNENSHVFGDIKSLADIIDRGIETARAEKFDPKPAASSEEVA